MIDTKLKQDILFVLIPAMSVMITLSWREYIVEYASAHLSCDPVLKKLLTALFVTLLGLTILYYARKEPSN